MERKNPGNHVQLPIMPARLWSIGYNVAGLKQQNPGERVDILPGTAQVKTVKRSKSSREQKTKGTVIVEEHRPLMNKLTDAERQKLMKAGYELIYGGRRQPESADRRRQ